MEKICLPKHHRYFPLSFPSFLLSILVFPALLKVQSLGHDQSASPEWVFCFATLVDLVSIWLRLGRDLENGGSLRAEFLSREACIELDPPGNRH